MFTPSQSTSKSLEETGNLKVDEACGILRQMEAEGCESDVVAFTTLMDSLCNSGRLNEAREFLNEMRRRKCSPNFFAQNPLIHKYRDSRDISVVLEIWKEMEGDGCVSDVITFTTLINALYKEGKVDEAFGMFHKMVNKGSSPKVQFFD